MEQWANYFIANAWAAAALTGLIFVAVSINLERILATKQLPDRASGSLILLANILIVSSLCLVPGWSAFVLGTEILLLNLGIWLWCTKKDVRSCKVTAQPYRWYAIQNLMFAQVSILPYIAAGVCMVAGNAGIAFYCLVLGITLSFIKALTDAWVLLIEIHR